MLDIEDPEVDVVVEGGSITRLGVGAATDEIRRSERARVIEYRRPTGSPCRAGRR